MNNYVELFLKPLVWVVWLIFIAFLFVVLMTGVYGLARLEIVLWRWNWIVAVTANSIAVYLVAVAFLESTGWPWNY